MNAVEPEEIPRYCLSSLEDTAQAEAFERLKPLMRESYEFAKKKFARRRAAKKFSG